MTTQQELCGRLKPAREAQKRTLSDLSQETGLPAEYLEALEEGRLDRMPDPAYARIYFVNYARALGLDVDEMMLFWPAPSSGAPSAVRRPSPAGAGTFWRVPLLVVILAGSAWLMYTWVREAGTGFRDSGGSELSAQALYDESRDTLAGKTDGSDSAGFAADEGSSSMPQPLSSTVAATPERSGSGVHTLEVRASASMWVVIEADGDTVRAGMLAAADTLQAEARRHFELTASTPSELKVWLDGIPLDLSGHEPNALVRHRIECQEGSQP